MRVRVDAPGNHQPSLGVDFFVGLDIDLLSDHRDLAVFDEDVGVVIVDSGDHAAVPDQRLHLTLPRKMVIVARNLMLCLALAQVASAGTYSITTAADSGPGSLRQAILDANSGACASPCSILYGSTSVLTVAPLTPLPDITASNVGIGPGLPYQAWTLEISGSNVTTGSGLHIRGANCSVGGVIINGFPGNGILLEDANGGRLSANIIGLDATGTRAVPNRQNGVAIVRGHTITLESNTIGGNGGNGVYASGTTDLFFGLNVIGK